MKEITPLDKKIIMAEGETAEPKYFQEEIAFAKDVKLAVQGAKADLKEAKGRSDVFIKEVDIGEYDKFISTYKIFKILNKWFGELAK